MLHRAGAVQPFCSCPLRPPPQCCGGCRQTYAGRCLSLIPQFNLFGGTVLKLGTARHHAQLLRGITTLDDVGCFALTELGFGEGCVPPACYWEESTMLRCSADAAPLRRRGAVPSEKCRPPGQGGAAGRGVGCPAHRPPPLYGAAPAGNNAVEMQTTATFDPATDEFVIHTPTPLAQK